LQPNPAQVLAYLEAEIVHEEVKNMANQNAVENSLATTGDSEQQGELNAAGAASDNAADTSTDQETSAEAASPEAGQSSAGQSSQAPDQSPDAVQSAPTSASAPARSQGELVDALVPVGDGASEQKEVLNGRPYEIVVIVKTTHGSEIESITQRATQLIEASQGAVDNVRTSDVRRFSYPINKEAEGSYVVLNARFVTTTVLELDRFFKLEEGVLRHLIVREDV